MKTLPFITISSILSASLFFVDFITDDAQILAIVNIIQATCMVVFTIFIIILIKQIADGNIDV